MENLVESQKELDKSIGQNMTEESNEKEKRPGIPVISTVWEKMRDLFYKLIDL